MVAQAQFSTTEVTVQPGDTETLSLAVLNLGNHTETFTLIPSGLLAGWVRLLPPTITLFGGSMETVSVTLTPPRLATTPAGAAPLTIRIIPQDDPDDVVIAETTAVIAPFNDRRVHLLQPVVRASRRATYEFLLENRGNSQASCRLHLVDTTRRLDGDFDPPAVGVEPGGTSLVQLKLRALHRHWRRETRSLPFTIEADQQGFPTAQAEAYFVQTPLIPRHVGRRVAAVVVLIGALVGAWFGVIKPQTDRAARKAARENTPTVIFNQNPTSGSGDQTAPTTTVAAPVTVPTSEVPKSEPFSERFAAKIGLNATQHASYTVPAGKQLQVSDYVLQNTNFDTGSVTISRNKDVLLTWNLDNLQGDDGNAFRSPLTFNANDVLDFQLDCDTPGGNTKTIGFCSASVLVSGVLVDAPTT